MSATAETVRQVEEATGKYKYGFVTDIEVDKAPKGLSEDTIRMISAKKEEPEWMLEWRLKAYATWLKMDDPDWAMLNYPPIDYQDIHYYSAPKRGMAPNLLMRSIPNCCAHMKSWVFHCMSRKCWPVLP